MSPATLPSWALGAAALVALGLGVYVAKKGIAGAAAGVVGAAHDAAAGTVVGIGEIFGIPATSADACQAAIAAGDTWRQSLDCPAGTFLAQAWRDLTSSEGGAGRYATSPSGDMTGATGGSADFHFPI